MLTRRGNTYECTCTYVHMYECICICMDQERGQLGHVCGEQEHGGGRDCGQAGLPAVVVEGGAEAALNVRILSPLHGASVRTAVVRIAVSGAVFGAAGVHVVITLDGEQV